MEQKQGILAGTILAVALLLRPAAVNIPAVKDVSAAMDGLPGQTSLGRDGAPAPQQGPWLASCNYWAPERLATDPRNLAGENAKPEVDTRSRAQGDARVSEAIRGLLKEPSDPGCVGSKVDQWGFPSQDVPIDLTTLIATVPDPVHTHLAMSFDRTIDVLLQAASDDNRFLSGSFWLPWRIRGEAQKTPEVAGAHEPGHDPLRERQPGLIIFRYTPETSDRGSTSNYNRVVFLFLVGESPSLGINGFQLQNALADEAELDGIVSGRKGSRFSSGVGTGISIIGPQYSGSAASLRAGIETAWRGMSQTDKARDFSLMGVTWTRLSVRQLARDAGEDGPKIDYHSMAANGQDQKIQVIRKFQCAGYEDWNIALLNEDNTVFGEEESEFDDPGAPCVTAEKARDPYWTTGVLSVRFPREISLLRNAEVDAGPDAGSIGSPGTIASPYLPFSVKDASGQDAVPQFSRESTPLSQEAQLMTIIRQLQQHNIRLVSISPSNPLDGIFLARFIHRAYPDAELAILGDLLMTREADNAPFIGALAFGPSPLLGIERQGGDARAYTDPQSIAEYNAAKYVFWRTTSVMQPKPLLRLQGYLPAPHASADESAPTKLAAQNIDADPPDQGPVAEQTALWATAAGVDGFYPLGILSFHTADQSDTGSRFLPRISALGELNPTTPQIDDIASAKFLISTLKQFPTVYASLAWKVICLLAMLLCLVHIWVMQAADYWTHMTGDLDFCENDQPRRRSMYIQVSTAALSLIAFTTAFPMAALWYRLRTDVTDRIWCGFLLACGLGAVVATLLAVRKYREWSNSEADNHAAEPWLNRADELLRRNLYSVLISLAWTATCVLALLWFYLCTVDTGEGPMRPAYLEGLSFSFRCVHPTTGVSPLAPVLLLLLGWYFWGITQTLRLRFSEKARPHLPDDPNRYLDRRFVVTEQELKDNAAARYCGLYGNLESLIFSLRVLPQGLRSRNWFFRGASAGAFALVVLSLCFFHPGFRSFDHFLWNTGPLRSSPYELLVSLLLLPLVWFSLSGWVRLMFIWESLRSGLLARLEGRPIRFAFNRLKGTGWMWMLSRAGLSEQRRDMDRCIESMAQMFHDQDFRSRLDAQHKLHELCTASQAIIESRKLLRSRKSGQSEKPTDAAAPPQQVRRFYELVNDIDKDLAAFAAKLMHYILIPYWRDEKAGLVEALEYDDFPLRVRRPEASPVLPGSQLELHAERRYAEPSGIEAAEEFVAIRYISLIRAVLVNMRYLMTFISLTFVLTIVAWNAYPFQPRQVVDWLVTGFLIILGFGVVRVFAQMHRDPVLSRITGTKPNELGWDFFLRIATYGAIPVLTWLAYEFPDVGSLIYRFLQPGTSAFK